MTKKLKITRTSGPMTNSTFSSPQIIFFGNGPLADTVKSVLLSSGFDIIFHARKKEDLETVKDLKRKNPGAYGVLASFGVLIKEDVLSLFEPEGILNIHPSLLPDLRGASPVESAILRGDTTFGVSVMKLVKAMDAGPIYYQTTLNFDENTDKFTIYEALATAGANWLVATLKNTEEPSKSAKTAEKPSDSANASRKMPVGASQNDSKATFCGKLETTLSELKPALKDAKTLNNEVRAYAKFPKSRYTFFNRDCIIHKAHVSDAPENPLSLKCKDGSYLCIDLLQPAGKKPMDAKSFLNGYAR